MPPRRPATTESSRRPLRRAYARASGPWRFGDIPVIGLIGGIGSGKSSVAALMAERGAHVLDADAIGHAILDQKPAREAVARRFGPEVLNDADPPSVDRAALAALVFDRPAGLRDLERILHPRMRLTFEKAIARTLRRREAQAIVLDAAVLLEAGWDDLCDVVWFVDAPRAARLKRVAASRGWTPETLDARESAQWPLEKKKAAATAVLRNAGTLDQLAEQVDRLWADLRRTGRQFRQAFFSRLHRADPEPDDPQAPEPPTSQPPANRRSRRRPDPPA
jgi:dephospho-CoA kinase